MSKVVCESIMEMAGKQSLEIIKYLIEPNNFPEFFFCVINDLLYMKAFVAFAT